MRGREPAVAPVHDLDSTDPLVRAAAHAGLGMPVPRKTRLRWLKVPVARLTWLTNRHQYDYNHRVIDAIEQLRRDLASVPPPHDLASHTEKHTVDLTADYNRAIAAAAERLTAEIAQQIAAATAG